MSWGRRLWGGATGSFTAPDSDSQCLFRGGSTSSRDMEAVVSSAFRLSDMDTAHCHFKSTWEKRVILTVAAYVPISDVK